MGVNVELFPGICPNQDLGIYSSSMVIFICLLAFAWYTALGMAGENDKVLFLSLGDCSLT